MKNLKENMLLKSAGNKSIPKNFGYILYQTGIAEKEIPVFECKFKKELKKLKQIDKPEIGNIITWEEEWIGEPIIKYAGIIKNLNPLKIEHKVYTQVHLDDRPGEIRIDSIEMLTKSYGSRWGQAKLYSKE